MSRKIILLAGFSILAFVQPALAQEAIAAADAPEGGLEEIVVTAQKREQNLQDVPISVTAISADALEKKGIADFTDLTRAAPALTVTQATSSPNNSIILRGIGTFAFSIGVEPSVAVIVDDLPVVQQAQAFDTLGDVERIEVLKGPQGTLFGKNASAGVVNIVTKEPTRQLSGKLAVTGATDDDYRVEAALSGPFGDSDSGYRVGAFYHSFKGNVHNLTTGHWIGDQEAYGIRAKLKFAMSDRVAFSLGGSWAKTTQNGTSQTIRSIDSAGTPRVIGGALLVPSLVGITPGAGNQNARIDAEGATSNETGTLTGRVVADLGSVNLIVVTGYQDWKYNFQNDTDNTDINVLSALTGGTLNGGIAQSGPYHSRMFTQEVRFVSTSKGPLKYVFGAFYADAKTDRAFTRGPVVLLANWDATATSKSIGLFAQVDYTLPTNTTISGGVRYNNEKIGVRFDNLLTPSAAQLANPLLLNAGCFVANNPGCEGTHSDDVVTWKGTISQELAPQIMAYASVAKGYKGFAYDVSSGFSPARVDASQAGLVPGTATVIAGVGPVKAEHSTSYELGLKSRFADNSIQFNLTGFYTDYSNFQAQSAVIVNLAPQFVLNNVGKLKTKGFEAELSAKPADWLRLDASASYTDARMTEFPRAQNYSDQTGATWNGTASVLSAPCTTAPVASAVTPRTLCSQQDRSGGILPNSPKFKFALGATGEFAIGAENKGFIVLNYQHQSSVNFDLLGNPRTVQAAYGIFNASVGAEFGPIKATLFVNNLFDTHYAAGLQDGFQNLGGSATNPAHVIYQVRPRDSDRFFGIKLQYAFGD
jgi:iron complex outermembrane receptor protein